MEDSNHCCLMVPNDIQLQRHLSRAYHVSPIGMHRGLEAIPMEPSHTTFIAQMWLSMWGIGWGVALPVSSLSLLIPNMDQFKFASLTVPSIQMDSYLLPHQVTNGFWMLFVITKIYCVQFQYQISKHILQNELCLMMYSCNKGFQQSNQGGEWLYVVLRQLTKLLWIEHIVTTSYCPRVNGSTEGVYRCLSAAIGIDCEKYEECWQESLQPAVYAHNVSPIAGAGQMSPFSLVFGRNAPSPEMMSLDLETIPRSIYAD